MLKPTVALNEWVEGNSILLRPSGYFHPLFPQQCYDQPGKHADTLPVIDRFGQYSTLLRKEILSVVLHFFISLNITVIKQLASKLSISDVQ